MSAGPGQSAVGVYGMGVMGRNLALNLASKGFRTSICNRAQERQLVEETVVRARDEGGLPIVACNYLQEFVESLCRPRVIIILIPAGKAVDDTLPLFIPFMEPGDVVVDGGNEWFVLTQQRTVLFEKHGLHFVGMGVSGGEEGARHGPSLMPGCSPAAWQILRPILEAIAAVTEDGPCVAHIGGAGSGNYVKMVHNGIEYGDMQLIAEVYDVLHNAAGMGNEALAAMFAEWNKGELRSFLVEITATILNHRDEETGEGFLVDKILDRTGMKGTGRWTVQQSAEHNVATPTIAAALDQRYISAHKSERTQAAKVLSGASYADAPPAVEAQLVCDARDALWCSKVSSYAQGMRLIVDASSELGWDIDVAECARIWKGGCIIRAALLDDIRRAYSKDTKLASIFVDDDIARLLNERQVGWRRFTAYSIAAGITCPAMTAGLAYFDSYRRARLPANLIQAQRDFFGGHSYERVDRDGRFHTLWSKAHKGIGDTNARVVGDQMARSKL